MEQINLSVPSIKNIKFPYFEDPLIFHFWTF
jgi:hypothetical protein